MADMTGSKSGAHVGFEPPKSHSVPFFLSVGRKNPGSPGVFDQPSGQSTGRTPGPSPRRGPCNPPPGVGLGHIDEEMGGAVQRFVCWSKENLK